jgi:hypothetical protein
LVGTLAPLIASIESAATWAGAIATFLTAAIAVALAMGGFDRFRAVRVRITCRDRPVPAFRLKDACGNGKSSLDRQPWQRYVPLSDFPTDGSAPCRGFSTST